MKGDAGRDIKHSEKEREKFTNFSQKSKEQYKSNEVKILGVLKHWAWMEGKAALKILFFPSTVTKSRAVVCVMRLQELPFIDQLLHGPFCSFCYFIYY